MFIKIKIFDFSLGRPCIMGDDAYFGLKGKKQEAPKYTFWWSPTHTIDPDCINPLAAVSATRGLAGSSRLSQAHGYNYVFLTLGSAPPPLLLTFIGFWVSRYRFFNDESKVTKKRHG